MDFGDKHVWKQYVKAFWDKVLQHIGISDL